MSGMFDPVHAAHAIERVSAAIEFTAPTSGNDWLGIFDSLCECSRILELPKFEDITAFLPQASAVPGLVPSFTMNVMPGARFVRQSSEGKDLQALYANRSAVQLESTQYIRWEGFEEVLKEVVDRVVSSFPESAQIAQVRLDYLDRFIERDASEPRASWREVLREGDHISPDHLDRETAWHTHVGWFEDDGEIGRLLLNLNADAFAEPVDAAPTPRSIAVYSLVSSITPGSLTRETEAIMKRFNVLHNRSKIAVRSILTTGMQSRISIDMDERTA
ncbi:TIGR04255 family protein [Methylobacterium sp. Leaf111]|uniref:TIGR04255 family protein n=1 Tax=Methylobacterium sp. Leaf111 TaxID=1736257 RepID=UPI000A4E442E|nr:TIGR04255 family protein [Methylobacterium sp. Leaf111]